MSLVKSPQMTEKKLAANRRNQKLSHGPVTDERRERIRAALLRFGFNAQAEEIAMRALGEEPAHFQELLEGLWEEWNPAGASQEGVVIRLARALWLMNRADRMQEGYAVRQAQEVNSGRQDRLHAQMMRLKMTEERLRRLAQSVEREHYVTTHADLEMMKNLHQEGELKDMGEIALALFYQLQAPGTGEDGDGPRREARRALVKKIKEIFGISSDYPPGAKPGRIPASPGKPAGAGAAQGRRTAISQHHRGGMGGAGAAAPASGKYPHAAGGDLRGAAQGHPEGVPEGSVALRTRRGNRAHPPRRAAHAENAGFQLPGSPADHQPAAED